MSMKRALVGGVLAVTFGVAGVATMLRSDIPDPPLVLDLQPGAFLADALSKSTYRLDGLQLAFPGLTQILLTPFESERARPPVITLRMSDNVATLPFVPARGDLYSTHGLVSEIELGFYNFEALAPESRRDLSGDFESKIEGGAEADIAAIVALFDSLRPFAWSGDQGAFCAPEIAVSVRYDWCMSKRLFETAWPSSEEVEAAVRAYHEEREAAWLTDDWDSIQEANSHLVGQRLTLGQWITENEVRVTLWVDGRFDVTRQSESIPPSQRARNLKAGLNIEAYVPGLDDAIRECLGENRQPWGGDLGLARLTPEEAKHAYSTLISELLEVDISVIAEENKLLPQRSRLLNIVRSVDASCR